MANLQSLKLNKYMPWMRVDEIGHEVVGECLLSSLLGRYNDGQCLFIALILECNGLESSQHYIR